jgi:hypothetical protein
MEGTASDPCAMDAWIFLSVAIGLSLLVALSEVAGAYHDRPRSWRAVLNRWALPLYLS